MFEIITLVLAIVLYFYSTRTFSYWKNKGVIHDKPLPLIGNHGKVIFLKKSWTKHISDVYRKFQNEKVVGYYRSSVPELIIRDPGIVKRILLSDFSHFHLRRFIPDMDIDSEPLMGHLFAVDGDRWKLLRQRLTPAFTSGKLKAMFPLIVERAERLHARIQATCGAPIDARDLMARFTTDFIGACGFGLDMDALTDEDSEFRELSRSIFKFTVIDVARTFCVQMFPKLAKLFNIRFTAKIEKIVLPLVLSVLKERNYEPSGRNDFVDLLLECKQKGAIVGESMERFKPDGTPEMTSIEITNGLMAAQMFVFFAAGFETSSATTSYTLHLLAYNPDKQKKVQENIDRVLSKYDNKLCYDAVKDMHYLEWALKESMRIFPSVGLLIRECAHKYIIPELDLTIDKGTKIVIPVEALQNDPEYFENPDQFCPERFSPQELNVEKIKFAYLPFGDGPRVCIGERLGLMQSMAALAAVLSKYSVEPAPASVRHPPVSNKPTFIQLFDHGLPLIFRKRE